MMSAHGNYRLSASPIFFLSNPESRRTGIAIVQARGLFEVNNSRLESAAMNRRKKPLTDFTRKLFGQDRASKAPSLKSSSMAYILGEWLSFITRGRCRRMCPARLGALFL